MGTEVALNGTTLTTLAIATTAAATAATSAATATATPAFAIRPLGLVLVLPVGAGVIGAFTGVVIGELVADLVHGDKGALRWRALMTAAEAWSGGPIIDDFAGVDWGDLSRWRPTDGSAMCVGRGDDRAGNWAVGGAGEALTAILATAALTAAASPAASATTTTREWQAIGPELDGLIHLAIGAH